jgi:hypothetical protein
MKRHLRLLPFAAILSLAMATATLAASASITPASQSHAHNVSSHWTLAWGTTSPYHVLFAYGDPGGNGLLWQNTNVVSGSANWTYSPCPGEQTTFTQWLNVYDGWNNTTGHYKGFASDSSTAHEASGSPC